ncbi:hypothetical protein J2X61_000250 [Bacillus sp. 3255]|nr:hypothetical protein [Bacillus sp. 3255]
MPLSFLSLWSINDALYLNTLQAQLDELRLAGLEGVIFHPRFYPDSPAYLSSGYLDIVSELILYAKATGMSFWIYDENGWPSGTANGEVLRRLPQSACAWVEWVPQPSEAGGGRIAFGSKTAVSSLDPLAAQAFLDITYEGYRQGLSAEAFDYVTGFFSDEVAFLDGHGLTVKTGAIPWDDRFAEQYERRYGEALLPLLHLLFTEGEGYEIVRVRYWEMLTDAIITGFYQPVAAWCEKHGKKFTAHLKAEESPFFQLAYSGSAFQVLKGVETPAIDALERFPGNNFYPRIAHSVAVQQGRSAALVEAMGGSGWGVSPQTFTDYCLWLASHGIEMFVLHLNQLKLTTKAVQDWPPSMPSHVTWKAAFPALLASIKEQAARLPDLKQKPDVLIVTPTRGVMAAFDPMDCMVMNEHDGSNIPSSPAGLFNAKLLALVEASYAAGVHYELTEERVIEEEGVLLDGMLRIGKRDYDCVLLADGCRWEAEGYPGKLRAAGVTVREARDWLRELPARAAEQADARIAAIVLQQSPWRAEPLTTNRVYVELIPVPEGRLAAQLTLEQPDLIGGLTLLLLDPVQEARVNGEILSLERRENGWEAQLPNQMADLSGTLLIEVTPCAGGEARPIAFVSGGFAVKSLSPLIAKDERQWLTDGPFRLVPLTAGVDAADLIASGFPFAAAPATVTKTVTLSAADSAAAIRLTDVQGDAAYVRLTGEELGWCWGPHWTVALPQAVTAGTWELEVSLYPSTFNSYGPHRHYEGDRYLTSPDQYRGVRNFADRPDAPEHTSVSSLHFVKWGISGDVELVRSE